jgi:hypothetical protein
VKQSPIARPVDGRCSSRKCFTAIQTARHSARISHVVPNIQVICMNKMLVLLKLLPHAWVPDRSYSTNICLVSMLHTDLKYIMEAYPLKHPCCIPRQWPDWRSEKSGIFQREIQVSSWTADTWRASEWSQWLACYLSQVNIVEPCNWLAHHPTWNLWQQTCSSRWGKR